MNLVIKGMMKYEFYSILKYFAFLTLLLTNFSISGQNRQDSYRDSINLSNSLVFKCDTVNALRVYKNLITSHPQSVFFHDYKNAIVLSISLKDNDFIKDCFANIFKYKKLDSLDFRQEFGFLESSYFEEYPLPTIKKSNLVPQRNLYFRDKLITMYTRDIEAHEKFSAGEIEAKQRDATDSLNYSIFYNLILTNQFKGENEIGLYLDSTNIWNMYELLFRHFVQAGYGSELISLLEDEHLCGDNLPIEILVNVIDLNDHMNKKLPTIQHNYINVVGPYICRPLIKYDSQSMGRINKKRSEYGLEKFHISLKYHINQLYCKSGMMQDYNFFSFAHIESLPAFLYKTEKDKEYLRSLSIDIQKELNSCICQQ